MDALEQKAGRMSRMTEAIMAAIGEQDGSEDVQVVMGSLGAAVGCMAKASGRPDECLEVMNKLARGVISGKFLD
jgi:hypothetical protein